LKLTQDIAQNMEATVIPTELSSFRNGEQMVHIKGAVPHDVAIVQSFSQPVDEHIIELLLLIDAAERAGARRISVVIPWMGYSLQDKVFLPGQPLSARVIA